MMNHDDDLIDTAEMYLRTVLELEEDGAVPRRARIAERLGHSIPTVSQTVARMQRDGLLTLGDDRRIELTWAGRAAATRVMRKHRLAECLLVDVLGLEWHLVHDEACRWEHVISDAVERRVLALLGHPTHSPYGNPIPALAELGEGEDGPDGGGELPAGAVSLADLPATAGTVTVTRIGEPLQSDTVLLARLYRARLQPGASVTVTRPGGGFRIGTGRNAVEIGRATAAHIFVTAVGATAAAS
jgi:DtxR family transcriptional regulator, Mn-dependent transcriptional regulator